MKLAKKTRTESPSFSLTNRLSRVLWNIIYFILFRYTPVFMFAYRRKVLLLFGAHVEKNARIYPSVNIWLPRNLTMKESSTLGPKANIYNQGHITIGENVIISQGAHLCASTHNYNEKNHPLLLAPIVIKNNAWVCAEAFIGPATIIEEGVVIGARAVVSKRTEEWTVYAGNPAVIVNKRKNFNEY